MDEDARDDGWLGFVERGSFVLHLAGTFRSLNRCWRIADSVHKVTVANNTTGPRARFLQRLFEFRMNKLPDLKYRIQVKFLPNIIGVGIDSFGGQVNFSCSSHRVISIQKGEKSLFLLF